jgi:hypothetical protein
MSESRRVERHEDMSAVGRLCLIAQPDGDIIVSLIVEDREHAPKFGGSVEFCSPGGGGGRSPHTIRALRELFLAMERDNTENPIGRVASDG